MDISGLMEKIKVHNEEILTRQTYKTLQNLFDSGSFVPISEYSSSCQDYEEVICGFGAINGKPAYAFCQDFDTSKGIISKKHINNLKRLYSLAGKSNVPIVGIYSSVGMNLSDEENLLSDMGDLINYSLSLSKRIPQVSIALGPCLGLNCILARCADVFIATNKAEVSIDIKNSCCLAETQYDENVVDIIVKNIDDAFVYAKKLLSMLPSNNSIVPPKCNVMEPDISSFKGFDSVMEKICSFKSYDIKSEILDFVFDKESALELSNNDGQAFYTGVAKLGGVTVGITAMNSLQVNKSITNKDILKIKKLIKLCEKFSIPLITFWDSKNFDSSQCAIDLYQLYNLTDICKINLIIGEICGSLAAMILSQNEKLQNMTIAWPSAKILLLPSDTMSNIKYNESLKKSDNPILDRKKFMSAFKEDSENLLKALQKGLISEVIDPLKTREKLFLLLELFCAKNVLTDLK